MSAQYSAWLLGFSFLLYLLLEQTTQENKRNEGIKMAVKKVEFFTAETVKDLELVINAYCERVGYEIVSVSISFVNHEYVAAVVVKVYT